MFQSEASMLHTGKAVKVIIYLSDGARHHGMPLYSSILDILYKSGIAGATVVKGIAGFGYEHRMHSAALLDISDFLPIVISFIDTQEKVDEVLPEIQKSLTSGLIEVQDTTVCMPPRPSH
ncbi:MAG: DUF190 domain-containing protein [Acidobacteriaceae bacterium]|nr:DUF190 domain-containing protein [Acidobacteriaceae bacterium]